MKKNLLFLALASLGLASCNGGFKKDDGGLLYDIQVDKDGPNIEVGDFVSVNVVAKTDADSLLFSTYESGHPIQTLIQKSQSKGDIFTGLEKLSEGDSATIKINVDSMFKKGQQKPPGFKGKYLVYNVKVEKVIAKGKLSEQVFQGRVTDYMKSQSLVMKAQEPIAIKKYIADNKLNVTTTADTLYYVVTTPGTGPTIGKGDTAVVNYTGRMLNGKVFDTSIKDDAVKGKMPVDPYRPFKPIHVPVGESKVIRGWDEGLQLLSKGEKITLIVPSSLAYGERGAGNVIGPFTPTVFTIELLDIIHPNPNAPKPVTTMIPPAPPVKH